MAHVDLVWMLGQDDMAGAGAGILTMLCMCIFYIALLLGLPALMFWKLFEKAGKPGWASVVPIYNTIVLIEIVGRPIWWFVLLLIPCVNIVIAVMLALDVAKCFGKDTGYAIGLILLPVVFYPILGFGSAQYLGPIAGEAGAAGGVGHSPSAPPQQPPDQH